MIFLYIVIGLAVLLVLLACAAILRLIFYPAETKKKTGIGSIFELDISKINIQSADNVRLLSPDQIRKIEENDY